MKPIVYLKRLQRQRKVLSSLETQKLETEKYKLWVDKKQKVCENRFKLVSS
jgi:hypothetical protein